MLWVLTHPARRFRASPTARRTYKAAMRAMFAPRRVSGERLRATLPAPPVEGYVDPRLGYRILQPAAARATWPGLEGVCEACERVIASGMRASSKGSKSYLQHVLGDRDSAAVPELLAFCLEPTLLAVVSAYLGELPVLASIKLLRSVPENGPASGSQLYHCDFDDAKQLKVFIHISDVDASSGPLTFLPSWVSMRVKGEIDYHYAGHDAHLSDDVIRPRIHDGEEVVLLGPRGTVALVDTSSNFHFGSRVATTERYLVIVQYVTPTSFLFNPWTQLLPERVATAVGRNLPYAGLARNDLTAVQHAVLTGRPG